MYLILCDTKRSVPPTVPKSYEQSTFIKNRTLRLLRCERQYWAEYSRTSDNCTYRQFKQARKQCTIVIREDKLQYQIKLLGKFICNLKNFFRLAASLQQAKTDVFLLLGLNVPTNNDGDTADLLTEQYRQTFQPSHTNNIDDSFTYNLTRLSKVNLSANLVHHKLYHLNKDTFPGLNIVHSAILRGATSILATLLIVMFSHSLGWSIVSVNWKLVHVTPILNGINEENL